MTFIKSFVVVMCAALLLLSTPLNARADVTLAWDSNVESDLAGYEIGYGITPGQYTARVDVGNQTSYSLTNLQPGSTYYFAVRAYNTSGMMSPFSQEVSAMIPAAPLELTNLVVNYATPMPVGTRYLFAAAPTGGIPPYQYKWFITHNRSTTVARDWWVDNTFAWTPTKSGYYTITAWVRSANNTGNAPENAKSVGSVTISVFKSAGTSQVAP